MTADVNREVVAILSDTLQLPDGGAQLTPDSGLLGEIAELDSMAVLTIITAFEERLGLEVMDDEIDADTFATLGTLVAFVEQKLDQG